MYNWSLSRVTQAEISQKKKKKKKNAPGHNTDIYIKINIFFYIKNPV
jgi:hypothetical protein